MDSPQRGAGKSGGEGAADGEFPIGFSAFARLGHTPLPMAVLSLSSRPGARSSPGPDDLTIPLGVVRSDRRVDDVVVRMPGDATVAELAHALGVGGSGVIDGRAADPDAVCVDAGLRRGSTVGGPVVPAAPVVARLSWRLGPDSGGEVDLAPGRHVVPPLGPGAVPAVLDVEADGAVAVVALRPG